MAGMLINAVENRMVQGEYYEDDDNTEALDEMPFERFDRLMMAALCEVGK